ncbi:hypothetical protein ACFYP0_30235 [Micromonospora arida]|uniref:hypothetical protein n=1 Tax=Micromonospora arida TaxID=2203715 RepID=UPI0033F23D05
MREQANRALRETGRELRPEECSGFQRFLSRRFRAFLLRLQTEERRQFEGGLHRGGVRLEEHIGEPLGPSWLRQSRATVTA